MISNRWTLAILCLLSSVGCVRWEFSLLRDHWDGELQGMARAAMRENIPNNPRLCEHDYAEGWVAGYESILRGASGQPPLVPPTEYMDPFTRRPSQANRVHLWHDGFVAGAAVAQELGVAGYARLPGNPPQDPAMLQPPFYCNDLTPTQAMPSVKSMNLPAPLPAVLTPDPGSMPSETVELGAPQDGLERDESVPSPSDSPVAPRSESPGFETPRPEALPAPRQDEDLLLPDSAGVPAKVQLDSVALSFQRLDQAAATARDAGWHVPLPPTRNDRVAESRLGVPAEASPRR